MTEILAALLVCRVSMLIVRERAPFGIMEKLRGLTGVQDGIPQADAQSFEVSYRYKNELAYLLSCVWCVSFWVGLAVAALLGQPLWYGLAYSAVAIFYDEKL